MKMHGMPAVALACVALVAGCATPYQPAAGEPMAKVRHVGVGQLRLCKDGKIHTLPTTDGVTQVPVGQRIDIGMHLEATGYNVIHQCGVWLSFVPEANQGYVSNSGLSGPQRCFMELVREDNTKETGVAPERTLAPASCLRAK